MAADDLAPQWAIAVATMALTECMAYYKSCMGMFNLLRSSDAYMRQ